MGWYGRGHKMSAKALQQDVLEDVKGVKVNVLDYKATCWGKRLWILMQSQTGEVFIMLYLLDTKNGMVKDIDESMGPCYYDCPLSLIEQANKYPISSGGYVGECIVEWRQKVVEYHKRKAT